MLLYIQRLRIVDETTAGFPPLSFSHHGTKIKMLPNKSVFDSRMLQGHKIK